MSIFTQSFIVIPFHVHLIYYKFISLSFCCCYATAVMHIDTHFLFMPHAVVNDRFADSLFCFTFNSVSCCYQRGYK